MKPIVLNSIQKLSDNDEIESCLLISPKGKIKVKAGNTEKIKTHDFATLAATILGAAIESNKLIEGKFPKKISVEDPEGYTIIRVIDKNNILLVRTNSIDNPDDIFDKIESSRWSIMRGL